jgi:hypothetical protein
MGSSLLNGLTVLNASSPCQFFFHEFRRDRFPASLAFVSWPLLLAAAAGLVSMRAAIDRGDVDEAAHQGVLAGPRTVERALAASDRSAVLAGIAAAPYVEDRAELLASLATVAARGDRRVAIPAAEAGRTIARELAKKGLPDDLAHDDVATWRTAWLALAQRPGTFIEVRIAALDAAVFLDPAGIDFAHEVADPDAAYRAAAALAVPSPVPDALRAPLGKLVATDTDATVATRAAQVLCGELAGAPPQPILDALGAPGLARIRALVTGQLTPTAQRELARCLAAEKSH